MGKRRSSSGAGSAWLPRAATSFACAIALSLVFGACAFACEENAAQGTQGAETNELAVGFSHATDSPIAKAAVNAGEALAPAPDNSEPAADAIMPTVPDASLGPVVDDVADAFASVSDDARAYCAEEGCAIPELADEAVEGGGVTIATDDGLALDVSASSNGGTAVAQLASDDSSANQRFSVKLQGIDESYSWYYTIKSIGSNKVIVDQGAQSGQLGLASYDGSDAQEWRIHVLGDGTVLIENRATGRMLETVGAANAVRLVNAGGAHGSWMLQPRDATIAGGAYTIAPAESDGLAFDIESSSIDQGGTVVIGTESPSAFQAYAISYNSLTGYYTIANYGSGLVLGTAGGASGAGTFVDQGYNTEAASQLWSVVRDADGAWRFISAINGMAMNLVGGSAHSGTHIELRPSSDAASQQFAVQQTTPAFSGDFVVIRNSGNPYALAEFEGGSRTEGASGQLAVGAYSLAHKFKIVANGDGTYLLRSLASGLYATVAADGTIDQRQRSDALRQTWSIVPTDNGHFAFVLADGSGLMLVSSGAFGGAQLVASSSMTNAAFWNPVATNLMEEGLYTISLSANESIALDVANASLASGSNVQLWTDNGNNAQKFYVRPSGNGTYLVTSAWSLLNLDVQGAIAGPAVNVQQYTCNNGVAQQWHIEWSDATGGFVLRTALAWFSLSAAGTYPSSNAQLAAYNLSDPLQTFLFTPTSMASIGFAERIAILDTMEGGGLNAFRSPTGISQQTLNELQGIIDSYHAAGRRVGFALIDLNSGSGVSYNIDDYFHSASTIKGPFVIALNKYWPWELANWEGTMWNAIDWSSNYDYETLRAVFGSTPLEMLMNDTHAWGFDPSVNYVTYTPRDLTKLWVGMADYLMSNEQNAWWCRDVFDSNSAITSRTALSWKGCTIYAKSGWVTGSVHNEGCLVMDGDNPYVMVVMTTDDWMYPQRMSSLMSVLDRAHSELVA